MDIKENFSTYKIPGTRGVKRRGKKKKEKKLNLRHSLTFPHPQTLKRVPSSRAVMYTYYIGLVIIDNSL